MHPRFLVTPMTLLLLELWSVSRPGLAGHGPLPFRGGWAEQPAWLMACLEEIGRCDAAFREAAEP